MRTLLTLTLLALPLVACSATGDTTQEKRDHVAKMESDTLAKLYAKKPETREQVESAAGYGVFTNVGAQVFFVGGGGGYGVVTDNETGERTYMKMGQATVGMGLGGKEFQAVFVFADKLTLKKFVHEGWEFGGSAKAAAKTDEGGGAAGEAGSFKAPIQVYQLTEAGVIASATVGGTKYWKDDELNR
jgi:lipid-binding SYLF domain-containing protein